MPSCDRVADATYTADEILRCEAAMKKPAPLAALQLIASGRITIVLSKDGRDVMVDTLDGQVVRDLDHDEPQMMGLSAAWPLFRAGMIDRYGVITSAGRAALADATPPPRHEDGGGSCG